MNPIVTNTKQKNDGKENTTTEIVNDTKNLEWTIIGGKKKWIRNCPTCNKEIIYTSVYERNRSNKNKKLCKTCCKLGNKNGRFDKGYILSGEKHFNFGKHLSKDIINKIRKGNEGKHIGIKNSMYGKSGELSPNKGKLTGKNNPMSLKENRYKVRITIINNLKKKRVKFGCKGANNYNPNACEFIDKLNEERGWNLQHAMNGGEKEIYGYFADGYDKERNIIFEYDEKHHYISGQLKEKDVRRMNEIKEYLNCKFLRYNEYTKELKEY